MSTTPPESYDAAQCAAYLTHLGLPTTASNLPAPSASLLTQIHTAHLQRIPFSSCTLHFLPSALPPRTALIPYRQGPGAQTDAHSCFSKLISRRAGGYCFENNVALAALLRGLGFGVRLRLCRANFAARGDVSETPSWTALGHVVCLVTVPASPETESSVFLADVGFGGGGLYEPMPLRVSSTPVPHGVLGETTLEMERGPLPGIIREDGEDEELGWTVYKRGPATKGLRLPIIHVHGARVHQPMDLRAMNRWVAADEEGSYVARTAVMQALRPDGAQKVMRLERVREAEQSDYVLKGSFYVGWPDGKTEGRRTVESVGELEDVLRDEFGCFVGRES